MQYRIQLIPFNELRFRQRWAVCYLLPQLFDCYQKELIVMQEQIADYPSEVEQQGMTVLAEQMATVMSFYNSDCPDYSVLEKTVDYLQAIMDSKRTTFLQKYLAEEHLKGFTTTLHSAEIIQKITYF